MVVIEDTGAHAVRPLGFGCAARAKAHYRSEFDVRIRRNRSGLSITRSFRRVGGVLAVLLSLRLMLAISLPLSFDEAYYWIWSRHLAWAITSTLLPLRLRSVAEQHCSAIRNGAFAPCRPVFNIGKLGGLAECGAASSKISARAWSPACCLTPHLWSRRNAWEPPLIRCSHPSPPLGLMDHDPVGGHRRRPLVVGDWSSGRPRDLHPNTRVSSFCGSLTIWLLAYKQARPWLRTVWPYAGASIAMLFFVPTLYWNAAPTDLHPSDFNLGVLVPRTDSHFLEFLGSQIALASPLVLVLAGFGLTRNPITAVHPQALSFASAVVWPALLYFGLSCPARSRPGQLAVFRISRSGIACGAILRERLSDRHQRRGSQARAKAGVSPCGNHSRFGLCAGILRCTSDRQTRPHCPHDGCGLSIRIRGGRKRGRTRTCGRDRHDELQPDGLARILFPIAPPRSSDCQ